jgi:hypothetical protein
MFPNTEADQLYEMRSEMKRKITEDYECSNPQNQNPFYIASLFPYAISSKFRGGCQASSGRRRKGKIEETLSKIVKKKRLKGFS